MKIETLKEWVAAMTKANPNGHVNLRTADYIRKLFNDELKNAIVFDNAGGMDFVIWEFKTKEEVEGFLGEVSMDDYLIYGHVKNGVQTLTEYQKNYPHWNIQKLEPRDGSYDKLVSTLNAWKGND